MLTYSMFTVYNPYPELQELFGDTTEGRLLLNPNMIRIQGDLAQSRVLSEPLLLYLRRQPPMLRQIYGWAVVDAANRAPLISWVSELPLLSVRPDDAHFATGQVYRAEVLHQVLALAEVLEHSRKEEWIR